MMVSMENESGLSVKCDLLGRLLSVAPCARCGANAAFPS